MNPLQIDIHNSSFTHIEGSDDYEFTDPISGEILNPEIIPQGLEADARIKEGLDYLRENGSRVDGKIILSRHASDLDLQGYDLQADAKKYKNVFFEGIGWRETDVQDLEKMSRAQNDTVKVSDRMARLLEESDFLKAKWKQLFGSGVNIRFADIADSNQPIDQMLLEWDSAWHELHQLSESSPEHKRAAAIAAIGYNNYREWYMCGILAQQLAGLVREGSEPSFVFILGTTHRNIVDKLKKLGVNVDIKVIDHERGEMNVELEKAIGRLSASGTELETIYS